MKTCSDYNQINFIPECFQGGMINLEGSDSKVPWVIRIIFFVLAKFIIPGRSKVVCLTSRHVPGFSIPWQFQSAGKNDPRQECWQIEFFAFHNNFKSSIYEFN